MTPPTDEAARVAASLDDAKALLRMLIAADDEAAPNGVMDCVDNDGFPYQSAAMAGLIVHARLAVQEPDDHTKRMAAYHLQAQERRDGR